MTKQGTKISAARKAHAAARAEQTIQVDDHWRVVHTDNHNWEVQYRATAKASWGFCGYYGSLMAALQSLPAKMLDPVAQGSLEQIVELKRGIVARIETTLKLKLA